jgi:AhpD family alkylhydroperoxidase
MARVSGLPRQAVPADVGLVYDRQVAYYGDVLVNHKVLARRPTIFRGFRAMWEGLESSGKLPPRLVDLVNMRVASLIGCALCMDINRAVGGAHGISVDEFAQLSSHAASPAFDETEKTALAYADALTGGGVTDEVFERVRRVFDDDAIVELTATIAFEICIAKFNRALGIEAQGVCIAPAPHSAG